MGAESGSGCGALDGIKNGTLSANKLVKIALHLDNDTKAASTMCNK
jgi:hypothetical protein